MMAFAIGCLVGAMIGLTGLGGGVLMTPVLIVFLGLPAAQGVGTALLVSALVKLSAGVLYLRRGQVSFPVLGWMLAGGLPGAALGAGGLEHLQSAGRNGLVMTVLGAIILVYTGLELAQAGRRNGTRLAAPGSLLAWLSLPIGASVGFSSAGSGALGTLLLLRCTRLTPVQVVGTDILFGLALAAVGGGIHLATGLFDRNLLIQLLAGGLLGGIAGAQLAHRLPMSMLRKWLLAFLVLIGAVLLYKGVVALWAGA